MNIQAISSFQPSFAAKKKTAETSPTHKPPNKLALILSGALGLSGCVHHPYHRNDYGYSEINGNICAVDPYTGVSGCIGGRQGSSGRGYDPGYDYNNGPRYSPPPQQSYPPDWYYDDRDYRPYPHQHRRQHKECGPTYYDYHRGGYFRDCWYNDAKDWLKNLNPLKSHEKTLATKEPVTNPFALNDVVILSGDLAQLMPETEQPRKKAK